MVATSQILRVSSPIPQGKAQLSIEPLAQMNLTNLGVS